MPNSGEIKIVITANARTVLIGIQRTDCDPQIYQVKDLAGAVKGIPTFLGMAEKVWKTNPRYAKVQEPASTPVAAHPAAAAATKPAATATAVKPATTTVTKPAANETLQPNMM